MCTRKILDYETIIPYGRFLSRILSYAYLHLTSRKVFVFGFAV